MTWEYGISDNEEMLTYKKVYALVAASLLSLPPVSCLSAESFDDTEDLFDLSMAELMEIPVSTSVASSKELPLISTPAIVSIYRTDEMAELGLRTLRDILSFIPGFIAQDGKNGNMPLMIRGLSEGFNKKVLFLLDDVPYWMPSHGEIPLLGIPIEAIDRVEVIRGPGSVYYGTNASAGVIKVITKKEGKSRLAVSGGSNDLYNAGGSLQQSFDQGSLSLGFEYQHDSGFDGYFDPTTPVPPSYPANTPIYGTVEKSQNIRSLIGRGDYKGYNLLVSAFRTISTGLAGAGTLLNDNELQYDSFLVHGSKAIKFDKGELKFFTDYNQFYLTFFTDNLGGVGHDGEFDFDDHSENYRLRGGVSLDYALSQRLDLFVGGEYEKRSTSNYEKVVDERVVGTIFPEFIQEENSLYGQFDFQITNNLRLLAGARYTDNHDVGERLTPRMGAVYTLSDHQSVKLLYSEGFNSPSFTQQQADLAGLVKGNPELDPETVENVDLAYSYVTPNSMFIVNLFYLRAEDMIVKRRVNNINEFFNEGTFERWGGELDFKYKVLRNWSLVANIAYNYDGNSEEDYASPYVPELTTAWGISWHDKGHQLGASLRTVGPRAGANSLEMVNVNYQYTLDKWQFFLTLRNVLDQEIVHPHVSNFEYTLLPSEDDFNFLAGLKFSF